MKSLFDPTVHPYAVSDRLAQTRRENGHGRERCEPSRNVIEPLEGRRLLSVAAADAAVADALPVADYYGGTVTFARTAGAARRTAREAVVSIESADPATGQITGTLSAAGLGNVTFSGQLQDQNAFALTVGGDLTGALSGRLRNGGTRLTGTLAADDGSTLRVAASALTAVGGTGLVPVTGASVDGLSYTGQNFTGSANGSVALRQRADGLAADGSTLLVTSGRTSYDLTLDLTAQDAAGVLTGTLSAGDLGSYAVTGLASGNRLVLVATPAAGADGQAAATGPAGVLTLTATGDGSTFVGRFDQASGGVFGTGRIVLSRTATGTTIGSDGTVLGNGAVITGGTVLADGSILNADGTVLQPDGSVLTGGTAGTIGTPVTAGGVGSFSGTGGPATAGGVGGGLGMIGTPVGTPIYTGTAVGTPIYAVGFTSLGSPVYTYSPVGSPAYSGTAVGTPAYVGSPTSLGSAGGTIGGTLSPAAGMGLAGTGLSTDGVLLTGQAGGAYGTAFSSTGSIFPTV